MNAIGSLVGSISRNIPSVDLTPGFNINHSAGGGIPYVSKGSGTTGQNSFNPAAGVLGSAAAASRSIQPSAPGSTVNYNGGYGGTGYATGSSGAASPSASDLAYLSDQEDQLRSLLGRTDVALSHGLKQNSDQYNSAVGDEGVQHDRALAQYDDNRVQTNKDKLSAYDTINRNAGTAYNSLAQIIGRASGTGSSAFRELLPNIVGKDTSDKRQSASGTYGENLQNIDKAQGITDQDFASALADLLKQKRTNEEDVRSGVEGQRQTINEQLAQNAAARAQANGGGYEAVKAAEQPYQTAIDNSRDAVESLFNQFRTPYNGAPVLAKTPDLSTYTTDRSAVNAQQQGVDPNNPYSAFLLKKRTQGGI